MEIGNIKNKNFRKLLLLLLTIVMLVSLFVLPVLAGSGSSAVTVSSRMEDVTESGGNQIYKLVFSAYSEHGISVMSTVLSYDNTVIVPVHRSSYADVGVTNEGAFSDPLNRVLQDNDGSIYGYATRTSYIAGSRTAFICDLHSTFPITSMAGDTPIFEFYFRLADGKTVDDMNLATFRIETDKGEGSILASIYTTPEALAKEFGLKIVDKKETGDTTYSYPSNITLDLQYINYDKKITPYVTEWPTPSAIDYGNTLEASMLAGGTASVPGAFTWDLPATAPTVSESGNTHAVTFIPTDTNTYNTVSSTLAVTVNKSKITKPVVDGVLMYTGLAQSPLIAINSAYSISNNSQINAGMYTATVSLNDTANYEWDDSTTADHTLSWKIDPADYSVDVPIKDIKVGSANSLLPSAFTTGVNSETPVGTLTWYASEADRTADTPIDDAYVKGLVLGESDSDKDYTLYWIFRQTADDNYIKTVKEGSTVITIINGDPQNIKIMGIPVSPVYGMANFILDATVTTTGDSTAPFGAITWSSSDTDVATINATTGEVDVLTAGTTTITATAAAVPGEYAAGTKAYDLVVSKLPVTVTAGTLTVTKVYDGTTDPGTVSGTLSVSGVLSGDEPHMIVAAAPQDYTSEDVSGQATVAVTLSLSGAKSANYMLTTETIDVPCSITPKEITAVSVDSVTKTYDGTTAPGDAAVDGIPTLTGKIASDDLDIALTIGSFNDADVVTADKTASVILGALTGDDAGNYSLKAGLVTITCNANIVPASITSITTAAPTAAVLANSAFNTTATNLKANAITLPTIVTVSYGTSSTEDLPISWADAEQLFNIKGGVYTYKGAIATGPNFNAYAPTLDAKLTVTPVAITDIKTVPATLTLAKSRVLAATALTDVNIGFPGQVTLSFNNSVADMDVGSTWNKTIDDLKSLAEQVDENTDKATTFTLTDTNFPAWATLDIAMPDADVTITNKLVIPTGDITFNGATITYGDVLSQVATVDPGSYPDAHATYVYTGTGSTAYGPSAAAPVNAGNYSVMATVQNDTHKGTKSATLTINRKALDVGAIAAIADQTYTGNPLEPDLTVTDGAIALALDTDYTVEYSNNVNAGVGTATVTITGMGNYTGTASATFTIEPKSIASATITITSSAQTYDGTAKTPEYTVKDGDKTLILTTDYTHISYTSNTNAGMAGINIAGAGNYAGTASGSFEIAKADYDMTDVDFDDAAKVYNGAGQSLVITGVLPTGEDGIPVTVSYSGLATNVSDGSQIITATFATESTNYKAPMARTAFLTIIPAEVTVSGITAADKTYDGNTYATLSYSGMLLTGKVGSDDLYATATGTFRDKNVGTNKPIDLSGLTLVGSGADNYALASPGQQKTATANITGKEVTISGITAADKIYDGTNEANVDTTEANFDGKIDGDSLTVSTTGIFENKNAGTLKTVTFGPLVLEGTSAGNYLVKADSQSTTTANIAKKEISVSGISALGKVYDGTTVAIIDTGSATFTGIEDGDTLTVSTTGIFDNKNAGIGKTVTLGTLTLSGTSAGNYSVKADSQATTTATITAKEIVVSGGIAAEDKTYDGTREATVDATGAIITGKIDGDDLAVNTTGTFADAVAETGKAVTFGVLTLNGDDANNYTLATEGNQVNTTATINKREVTVNAITAANKAYDGTTEATLNTASAVFGNKLPADNLTVTAVGTFADKNAGNNKPVTLSGLVLGGIDVANYVISPTGNQVSTIANIDAKEVTVSGITAADKTYDGTIVATIDVTGANFEGIVGGDTLTVSTSGAFADANAATGKTVTLTILKLGGVDADNYTVKSDSQTTTKATINKANQATLELSLDKTNLLVGNSLTASATGGSGDGTVSYVATLGTVSGSTITATSAGTMIVTATKAASTNYNSQTSNEESVTILDKIDLTAEALDLSKITDPAVKAAHVNIGRYTITSPVRESANGNHFTLEVKGTASLASYTNGGEGDGKWIAIMLGDVKVNDLAIADTTGIYHSTSGTAPYTPGDLAVTTGFGGADGQMAIIIDSDEAIGAGKDIYIANNGAGINAAKITINFTAYVPTGGGGGSSPIAPPVDPPIVNPPVTTGNSTTVTTVVTPTTKGVTSSAVVDADSMNTAVDNAIIAASASGTSANLEFKIDIPSDTTKVQITLPKESIEGLIDKDGSASITVTSGVGAIMFDGKALSAIGGSAKAADIVIVISELENKDLNKEQKALVGDRPVVDLYVMSGGKRISDFKGGSATISIPYTLAEGENSKDIVIWYLADNGKLEKIECNYDPITKTVIFVADHFSKYVIAYFPFDDLKGGEWYYENTVYAYTNGLFAGVGNFKFDPSGKTTRAMLVTILHRLEGEAKAPANSFKDVPDSWYSDAVSWASANGIASGYSSSKFGPNDPITREQMAAIIYNYGVYKGYDMSGRKDLTTFADSLKVSYWAKTPMEWAVENGIISGVGNSRLDPSGSGQRAHAAAILQRFIENTEK